MQSRQKVLYNAVQIRIREPANTVASCLWPGTFDGTGQIREPANTVAGCLFFLFFLAVCGRVRLMARYGTGQIRDSSRRDTNKQTNTKLKLCEPWLAPDVTEVTSSA